MKKHARLLITLVMLSLVAVPRATANPGMDEPPPKDSCTVFGAAEGDVVLVGNNEDFLHPLPRVWFLPPEGGKFGRIYFGFENQYQGGMNDQGLFFDGTAVDPIDVPHDESKPIHMGNLILKAMEDCATVECVLEIFETFSLPGTSRDQFFVADSTGDSAIIELGTVVRKSSSYQVATNFRTSSTEPITCERYLTAEAMLASAEAFTVDLFRDILDAVQNAAGGTTYSNIYDLKQRIVYVYFYHDFEHPVVFNLDEELEQGAHVYELPDLFARNEDFELWALPQLESFGTRIEMRTATDVDPQIYASYVGEYELPAEAGWLSFPPAIFSSVFVVQEGDRLLLSAIPEMLPLELRPESETDFFYADLSPNIPDFKVTFIEDSTGSVVQAAIDFEGLGTVPFLKIRSEVPALAQLQLQAGEAAEKPLGFGLEQLLWLLVPIAAILVAFWVWRGVRRRSQSQ
ncbi:MAG: hypothetical protein PVF70_06465 [Anaerolineales bacterium]|jgi:hypothetical protein